MARNKNARAAAQLLAGSPYRLNPGGATAGASTMSATSTPKTTRHTRAAGHALTQLWNPSAGIRFAAEPEPLSLYPTLDFKRFFHSHEGPASSVEDASMTPAASIPPLRPPAAKASVLADDVLSKLPYSNAPKSEAKQTVTSSHTTPPPKPTAKPTGLPLVEPPLTSLDFNICNDLFQAARSQPKGSPGSFWSHTMYKRAADGAVQNVKVHYCTTKHTMEHVCARYFADEPVLGFDLEWVAFARRGGGARENVSLIQLASPGRIALFHVALFPKDDFVAPAFRRIMGDEGVRKVGVHIQADCTRLRNFLGVETRGIFELSHMYKLVKHAEDRQRRKLINKTLVSLSTQVEELLKLPLFKGQDVRSSNWSKPLDAKQLTYSAADAYAGLQLYHVLDERRLAMDPAPERPSHAELGLPIPIPPTPVVSDVEDLSDAESLSAESMSDSDSDESLDEPVQQSISTRSSTSSSKPQPPRDPRIVAAEAQVLQRRKSRPAGRLAAGPSALRTFYLWEANDDLSPDDVAKLLRDPPLQVGTVIGYILDSIRAEKLAFPKERLKREVLSRLHSALATGKYRDIVEQCE